METLIVMPASPGQICRILNPMDDTEAAEVYIIAEDPAPYDPQDNIYVVSLTELQRNIGQPEAAERIPVPKQDLTVIAETLSEYIQSWNHNAQ